MKNQQHKVLTHKEIEEIRECPVASYLDLVKMLATYDETMKELRKVQGLSSAHYQHQVDAMKMYQESQKKLKEANYTAEVGVKRIAKANVIEAECKSRVEEAEKSREYMCGEAGRYLNEKKKILEFINSSKIYLTYDSVTDKSDTVVKFSKIEFEKLLESLEE